MIKILSCDEKKGRTMIERPVVLVRESNRSKEEGRGMSQIAKSETLLLARHSTDIVSVNGSGRSM